MGLRVFIPNKREALLNELLKDLYLLRQAVDHQSGTPDGRIKMVDSIRNKLRKVIDAELQED